MKTKQVNRKLLLKQLKLWFYVHTDIYQRNYPEDVDNIKVKIWHTECVCKEMNIVPKSI